MSNSTNKLTFDGIQKLEQELEYLKGTKKREVAERLKVARSFGDLSENSEYDDARIEQGQVETRIAELEAMLKNIEVISDDEISVDSVGMGSKVTLYDEEFEEEVLYQIVGSLEADPMKGTISNVSPIGLALNGKKKGDIVKVKAPAGDIVYKILNITK